jgi:hypothetical protein
MSIAGGGLTKELGEFWNIELFNATSLDAGGYVLAYKTEDSRIKVDKCGASDVPACVNYRSTRDPEDMNQHKTALVLTGADIGTKGIPVLREGWAKLKVATNNSAISRGNPLVCTGSGKVDLYTPSALNTSAVATLAADVETRFDDLGRVVGHAEEDGAAGTTSAAGVDKILTKLSIRAVGIET